MNLRQPFEQLIADKLRQLRTPDADASWQQMKRLLDDDDDRGAGGRKRPPGNNGLWRIGIIAVILVSSFFLYNEKAPSSNTSLSKQNQSAPQIAGSIEKTTDPNTSIKNKTTAIDNTTTLPGSGSVTNDANKKETGDEANENSVAAVSAKNTPKTSIISAAANTQAGTIKDPTAIASYANAAAPAKNAAIKSNQFKNTNNPVDAQNVVGSNKKNKGSKYKTGRCR